jgi:hypothetical protein
LEKATKKEILIEHKEKLVFGQSLQSILTREGVQVPLIVTRCCEYLTHHGIIPLLFIILLSLIYHP